MRNLAGALLGLGLLACSSNNPTIHLDMGTDMSVPITGCLGILACVADPACTTTACFQGCLSNGTARGRLLFNNLLTCLDNTCPTSASDAGPAYCPMTGTNACCNWCYDNAQRGSMSMVGICMRAPSGPAPCAGQVGMDGDGVCGACVRYHSDCVADTP